jgi:hypothetical protein
VKAAVLLLASVCAAQNFTHRGFIEVGSFVYPQDAVNDSGNVIGEALLRYEAFYRITRGWRLAGGIDARTDTHRQVEREARLSWWDRERRRPAFSVRRLSAGYARGRFSLEAGKQLIRWGKADILNPTDRFAPRDFLNVVSTDWLGVTAARLTYGDQATQLEAVYVPRMTPSRVPLIEQRWAVLPPDVRFYDTGAAYPGGGQAGIRFNHAGSRMEFSASFYEGYNHLPLIRPVLELTAVGLQRHYAQMRMFGGEAALPLRFLTVKAEGAWFGTRTQDADEYALYVIQAERHAGEWFFVGGYAGEAVTERRSPFEFAPDRGLARAFLGRAGYTIDANRSLAVEAAVRQDGGGLWTRGEYTHALGARWRATVAGALIRGRADDFLGQYRRNSFLSLALRYSF